MSKSDKAEHSKLKQILYAKVIEKEVTKEDGQKDKESYVWVGTDLSLNNLLNIFDAIPIAVHKYTDRNNLNHYNLLYKDLNSDSYLIINTVYDPLMLKYKPKEKNMTLNDLRNKPKIDYVKIKNTENIKTIDESLGKIILDGLKIESVKSLGHNNEIDELDITKLKDFIENLEENGMKEKNMEGFVANLLKW